jgi:hypothetical protein
LKLGAIAAAAASLTLLAGVAAPLPASAQLTVGGTIGSGRITEYIQRKIEEQAEILVEDNLEEDVQDEIEGDIELIIEDSIEESLEDSIASNLEENAEETLEGAVEASVAEAVEASVETAVEEGVAAAVEDTVEEGVAQAVEESVATAVERSVEEAVAGSVEDSVAEAVEQQVEEKVAENVEGGVESAVEEQVVDVLEDRLESEIDEILERIETELEVDERRLDRDQWLVMAEPEVFDELAEEGFLFHQVTDLPGMGLRLAEVSAPGSFKISDMRQGVVDVVGSDRAEIDLNHYYTAGSPTQHPAEESLEPRSAIVFPADMDELDLRIGMIDSQVDVAHPSLRKSRIRTRSFASEGARLPEFHGTAIASIIAASDGDFRGLAPKAELYAAAVFEHDEQRGEVASTVSLVRALDWLISSGVDVINLSLAGPSNRLLEAALSRAAERRVTVLAAAGNGGPVAKPMYPAAYPSVVAVTAVDASGRVYRLANRGAYLDLAAPGVGLRHARAGGGYTSSSGTSFAVPFAVAAAARLRHLDPAVDVVAALLRGAEDLGPPGRDEIYGYGLLRPGA